MNIQIHFDQKVYEGKAKVLYSCSDPDLLAVRFKDDATAFNAQKKGNISGKGKVNNLVSKIFFDLLNKENIPHHFVSLPDPETMIVKKVKIIPIEVVVRNLAAGSMAKAMNLAEGQKLKHPVIDFYYKSDELGDPYLSESRITALDICSSNDLEKIKIMSLKINEILTHYLENKNLILVDFKLEFGTDSKGQIILADEISPDTCRFWDSISLKKLDKDRFRQDLGEVEEAYQEILLRVSQA